MQRRKFLRGVAAGGAALTLAACGGAAQAPQQPAAQAPAGEAAATTAPAQAPAQGTDMPAMTWDMPTSWGPSIPVVFSACQRFAARVGEMTGGRLTINAAEAGKIVPGLQVYEAIENGTAFIGHTASFYWVGRDPAWGIPTALPFGLTTQQSNAWYYYGGGKALYDEFFAENGIVYLPAGNTTQQMGGWFKKEVNAVSDLQGLKMRIPGIGGQVMTRLGVTTQQIAGGEIFQALSAGTVDAAEFIGPVEEEKLGFQNAAEYYMYPGWWEPAAVLSVFVSKAEWDKLPALYQQAITVAAAEANVTMVAQYDAENMAALRRLQEGGTQLKPFSQEIMQAAQTAAFELYAENSASSPAFKKMYEPWLTFRNEVYNWHGLNEYAFMNFVYNNPVG
jgi:TRAP-type mannitol/chloroaromatic compound transport system substrate-binding protein